MTWKVGLRPPGGLGGIRDLTFGRLDIPTLETWRIARVRVENVVSAGVNIQSGEPLALCWRILQSADANGCGAFQRKEALKSDNSYVDGVNS